MPISNIIVSICLSLLHHTIHICPDCVQRLLSSHSGHIGDRQKYGSGRIPYSLFDTPTVFVCTRNHSFAHHQAFDKPVRHLH